MGETVVETPKYDQVHTVEASQALWIRWEAATCAKCDWYFPTHLTAIRITGPGGVILDLNEPNEIEQRDASKYFDALADPILSAIRKCSDERHQLRHQAKTCAGCLECDDTPCTRGNSYRPREEQP